MTASTYRLTPNELALWLHYVEHQVGFVLPRAQSKWIKWVLERHLKANHLSNTEFLAAISADSQLYHQLFDDLLIPRTQFFRHLPTFEFIEHYAKAWQDGHAAQTGLDGLSFTAWSVGCSTGQEPVSTAMSLKNTLPATTNFTVYGSDFHQQALAQATQGYYEANELAFVPQAYQQWLIPQADKLVVAEQLRKHLTYFSLNLVQPPPLLPIQRGQCQVIICQNVLIYFRQFLQRDVLKYLSQFLADDGVLLLGTGEILRLQHGDLVRLPLGQVDGYVKPTAPPWLVDLAEQKPGENPGMVRHKNSSA